MGQQNCFWTLIGVHLHHASSAPTRDKSKYIHISQLIHCNSESFASKFLLGLTPDVYVRVGTSSYLCLITLN